MPRSLKTVFIIQFCFFAFTLPAKAQETLTWARCVAEAQKNNPDLISAKEEITQSEASKAITRSGLLPQVSADLGLSTEKSTGTKSTRTYSYGANATQLVFDGFKTIDNVKAASENIKASRQAYHYTSSEIRFRLRSAFINLLRAQEMVKVAGEIFELRRNNLELVTLRYESGLEHKGALLTEQANVAQAKLEIEKAKREVEVAQWQLNKEMGRAKFEPISIEGGFEVAIKPENPDFSSITKNHPSLQQLAFQKNAARYGVKSAYANFFPVITGQLGVDKSDPRWPPRDKQWGGGVSLSLPIFEGGLKIAQVQQAESLFRQYDSMERSMRDTLAYNLRNTWAGFQDAVDGVEVEREFLRADEERAKIAEAQYSLGMLGFDNWTIIQDDLVSAKRNLLDSQANALLAEANWIQSKGETLEYVE